MDNLYDIIIDYTKEVLRKTALGNYIDEFYVEQKIYRNITSIRYEETLNYESPKIEDGVLTISPSLLKNNNEEYIKEILTSFGLYSVISDCKKYNPTNDMLATYFSALSVRGDNYRNVSSLNESYYSFLSHNLIYSNQISIFHELIGEDAMAKLVSKIDKKHSFYDNLSKLVDYMKIPHIFNRRDLNRLEKLMDRTHSECNVVLHTNSLTKSIKRAFPKFNIILNRFSNKFSDGVSEFVDFYRNLLVSKIKNKKISKKYDIDISDINITNEELVGLKKILNIFDTSMDFSINSYDDIYTQCSEYLKLNVGLMQDLIKSVVKKQNLVDEFLLTKFVIPVVGKYGMNNEEKQSIKNIFPGVKKNLSNKRKIKK